MTLSHVLFRHKDTMTSRLASRKRLFDPGPGRSLSGRRFLLATK